MTDRISIRPGVGMLGLFPHMKYQPWYALGELVDNAIQSYLLNKQALLEADPEYRLRVEIMISQADGGSIIVKDNAAGVSSQDWERAFRVAEPPSDATGLSQFGIGMKAACCWFAKEWSLRTTVLDSQVERSVSFDVPRIVRTRDESLVVDEVPAKLRSHYTVIEMTNLNRPVRGRTKGKIKDHLGGIYRQFLRDGELELLVDGEHVNYDDPAVLVAPRQDHGGEPHTWRHSVDITLGSDRRITGFVAIREKGETRQAGLALFYRRKVVTGSGEDFYKPQEIFGAGNSFQSQRVFGELHMDAFDVTYTKDALVWYDEEEEFVEALRSDLDSEPWPLIRQAVNYRRRAPEEPAGNHAADALDRIVVSFEDGAHQLVPTNSDDTETEPESPGGSQPVSQTQPDMEDDPPQAPEPVNRRIEVDLKGEKWEVKLGLVADETVSRWLTVAKGGDREIELTVNQSHPFMRAWCEIPGQELEPVWRVAVALGLAQEMARLGGAKQPGMVTENVNLILRNILSRKN